MNAHIESRQKAIPCPKCNSLIGHYDPRKGVNAAFYCKKCKKEYPIRKLPDKNY